MSSPYLIDHIEQEYREWRKRNPDDYQMFARQARKAAARVRRYSIKTIAEVLRHHATMHGRGDTWKVNNNYPALIARDLMAEGVVPEGFFSTRERRAE